MNWNRIMAGRPFSPRKWLPIVVVVGLAWAALRTAHMPAVLAGTQAVVALVVLAICVAAVVDRGERQAFAVGFTLCVALFWLVRIAHVPFFTDNFGTDVLTNRLHSVIAAPTDVWEDNASGRRFNYDPSTKAGNTTYRSSMVRYTRMRIPDLYPFHRVAVWVWTIVLGFCGGVFSRRLYMQRAEFQAD